MRDTSGRVPRPAVEVSGSNLSRYTPQPPSSPFSFCSRQKHWGFLPASVTEPTIVNRGLTPEYPTIVVEGGRFQRRDVRRPLCLYGLIVVTFRSGLSSGLTRVGVPFHRPRGPVLDPDDPDEDEGTTREEG